MLGRLILVAFVLSSTASGAEIVVVRPAAWSDALTKWKAMREAEQFSVIELEPQPTAATMRAAIQAALKKSVRSAESNSLPTIVLMGDAPTLADHENGTSNSDRIPTFYVDSQVVRHFGSEPTIATDQLYSDWNEDGIPEAVVGRIPADSREGLQRYLHRIVAFEKGRIDSTTQRQIDIVAGVGDFGIVADAVIEGVTRQLLTNDLPEAYQLSMTQASSRSLYCPAPERFRQSVVDRLNDGGLFWVYLGHGFVNTLDYLKFTQPPIPILDTDSLQSVSIPKHPPIALVLACYVGAFDARVPSLAESMLLQVDGPIAVIAASRVTMPYAMGIFGDEMLQQCFVHRQRRIGTLFSSAKRVLRDNHEIEATAENASATKRELMDAMAKALSPEGHSLEKERHEHSYLFNLLGDPLISIRQPSMIEFTSPDVATPDQSIVIRGMAPSEGEVRVELACRRTRIPDQVKVIRSDRSIADADSKQQLIYDAANNLTVELIKKQVSRGPFEITLPANTARQGHYLIHVVFESNNSWAIGTRPIQFNNGLRQ